MLQDLSVSVSCRLYVSELQAQTMSHVAGNKSVSVLKAVTMSVCCKLQQCQCVAHINICQCVASSHNVSVLYALTFVSMLQAVTNSQCQCVASSNSVSVLHTLTFVSVLQALTMSVCCTH